MDNLNLLIKFNVKGGSEWHVYMFIEIWHHTNVIDTSFVQLVNLTPKNHFTNKIKTL